MLDLVCVRDDVLDESCDGDGEDELVPELDDSPGTTICTRFFRFAFDETPLEKFLLLARHFASCQTWRDTVRRVLR